MKQNKATFLFSLLSLLFLIICDLPSFALPPQEIAKKTFPSVISLIVTGNSWTDNLWRRNSSLGTGFFVDENIILTNLHVLFPENVPMSMPKLSFKRIGMEQEWCQYKIMGIDYQNDLVILWIENNYGPPLHLGKNNEISIGDTVFAVGSPQGYEGTFSQGIVSGVRRENGNTRLQITSPLSPGSSGGPVLNSKGEVIGIAYSQAEGGQNLNFAIPIEYAEQLLLNSEEWIEIRKRGIYITGDTLEDDPRFNCLSTYNYYYQLLGDNSSRERFEYAIKTGSLTWLAGNDKGRVLLEALYHRRHPDEIKMLIEDGADVNRQGDGGILVYCLGKTPLHMTFSLDSTYDEETLFKITKLLLDAGANIQARDRSGNTPLISAMEDKNTNSKLLALLINAGANVNNTNNHGETPLHVAAKFTSDSKVVEMLIAAGSDPNKADKYGRTPLIQAKSVEVAKALLKNGAEINFAINDRTTLHTFIEIQSLELIAESLAKGADPNTKEYGNFPLLHYLVYVTAQALANDDFLLEALHLLVEAGANVNARDFTGETPLHLYTWRQENEEGLRFLLDAGVDVNARNNEGETVLHGWFVNPKFVKILIDSGADVNARTKSGKTPLMSAVKNSFDEDDLKVIESLFAAGADVNAKTIDGWTALMVAAHGKNLDLRVITKLIEAGADVNASSKTGWTPLLAASANNNNTDVVLMLLKAGADANAKTKSGKTALDLIKENPDLKNSEAYWKLHDAQF